MSLLSILVEHTSALPSFAAVVMMLVKLFFQGDSWRL